MTTFVGSQSEFEDAVKELIELDYDTVEAYEVAIDKITNAAYKAKMTKFMQDHLQHIKKLSDLMRAHNLDAPEGPSLGNKWLTKGKVVMANLLGDNTILKAMLSNEVDANVAYERMRLHEKKWPDAEGLLDVCFKMEQEHKAWFESVIK